MSLVETLTVLKDKLQNKDIDLNTFNEGVKKAVESHKATLTDADKAKAFDKLIDYSTGNLTRAEEFDRGVIYWDSDWIHYEWENLVQTLYGNDFFKFYNSLYEGC